MRRSQRAQQVAELVLHVPDLPDARITLVAEADVARGGFVTRIKTAAAVMPSVFWVRI
jgi:serine-type D-Ala-D-Ala carboxypeptidase (penicillin-binding protein 5/6)